MSKRPYRLVVTWMDRKWGPQTFNTAEEASSMRRAINQAPCNFFSDKSRRKERGDAHASLTVTAQRGKAAATARRRPL